jgi:uncharacterized Fe-S cluster-containing MiaB family protein
MVRACQNRLVEEAAQRETDKRPICSFKTPTVSSKSNLPAAASPNPDKPYAVLREQEPALIEGRQQLADVTTIFLTASRCPIGCRMCGLHQYTLPTATPAGAITRQIRTALQSHPPQIDLAGMKTRSKWIKLYNSGNFFDPASIPPDEYGAIAELCRPYSRIIVENHPRFGSQRLEAFRDMLAGKLEVAVGLETVQPRWLDRMRKKMTRDQFDRYARHLKQRGIDLRVFLIVGVPGSSPDESIRWARLSIRHAVRQGARHISLIPARPDESWGSDAQSVPEFSSQQLRQLQADAAAETSAHCFLTIDGWGSSPSD